MSNVAELDAALLKVSPRNGDIVFIDGHVFDLDTIANMQSPSPDWDDIEFFAVYPERRQSVQDCVMHMSKSDLVKLLK